MPYLPQQDVAAVSSSLLENTRLLVQFEQHILGNLDALRNGTATPNDVAAVIGAYLAKVVEELGLPPGSLYSPTLLQAATGEARRLTMKSNN